MTDCTSRAVAPVSAVCAAFAAQPSVYTPSARKSDVAPPCRSVAGTASAEEDRLRAGFGGGRSRKRQGGKARQEKRLGAFLRQSVHFCPQCGQFRAVKTALFCEGEKWIGADFRKKPRLCRSCRHYFGAFHFWRG